MSEHNGTPSNYAPNVRAQYEAYPFPLRDPRDEARRLVVAEQECLGKLNHYCFGGMQSFNAGFRVLVAGGGTGDHTIFLAEQLRDYDASVTYVDISQSSMSIAKERAQTRGLHNIEWHHSSILDLPSLELDPFDLVSCTGVLHHLPEPERGIEALSSVLKAQGAMSLMLYGRMGRLPVYAGQELMRLVNSDVDDSERKTRNARAIVQGLPKTNWLLRGQDSKNIVKNFLDDESNLNDVLLHEQDCAYSVPEIYDILAVAGLELIEFTSFHSDPPCFRYLYDPMTWISDPMLASHVAKLPRARQQAIAEAMHCSLTCHAFYAAPSAEARIASPDDLDMVPFFLYFDASGLAQHFRAAMAAAIDGSRSLGEMIDMVRRETGDMATQSELLEDFMAFYRPMNCLDIILLRHRSIEPFREFPLEVVA
jgi:2-polyprenyl-3-methyl-5-hydroxy-6-metoxy-1,4-benzoquinol methylase